jgi:hypothetical protein
MAISTYAELQTAVQNFLGRTDISGDRTKEFIAMAEARMSRELESRSQEKRATSTLEVGTDFYALPTDLRTIRSVKLNTSPVVTLVYHTPNSLTSTFTSTGNGRPQAYTVIGDEIRYQPTPDSAYTSEITYIDGLTALSDSATSNTVLTRHPDAYLYGSLSAAAIYFGDDTRLSNFEALFKRAIDEINTDEERSKTGGGGLFMKSDFGES